MYMRVLYYNCSHVLHYHLYYCYCYCYCYTPPPASIRVFTYTHTLLCDAGSRAGAQRGEPRLGTHTDRQAGRQAGSL
jgi:hypothetical protein